MAGNLAFRLAAWANNETHRPQGERNPYLVELLREAAVFIEKSAPREPADPPRPFTPEQVVVTILDKLARSDDPELNFTADERNALSIAARWLGGGSHDE